MDCKHLIEEKMKTNRDQTMTSFVEIKAKIFDLKANNSWTFNHGLF
jgi:hypothetical protein